jgi:hypothetical protein
MKEAMGELAVAHEYARNLDCDPWQFAVEISRMKDLGLTASDLRWLSAKGFVSYAREVTEPGDLARRFTPGCNTAFFPDTRFLLTDSGQSLVGTLAVAEGCAAPMLHLFCDPAPSGQDDSECVPRWDMNAGTLYLGDQIVKRFKRPSPNQVIILKTFEEEGWPAHIDDPLPPTHHVDPKRRLHDTIKWLNRNQQTRLLQFSGDGTGEGIRWIAHLPGTLPISAGMAKIRRSAA